MLRPWSVALVELAAAVQVIVLVGTSVIAILFDSFFDLFGRTPPVSWLWHVAPSLGGFTLRPALAGLLFVLVPLQFVLFRYRIGRPALIVGEVLVCVPAVGLATTAAHAKAGGIIVAFVAGFVLLGVLCIGLLLSGATNDWLTKSLRLRRAAS